MCISSVSHTEVNSPPSLPLPCTDTIAFVVVTGNCLVSPPLPPPPQDPLRRMQRPSAQEGKPLKEQWSVALGMRVGMLKMGGFLHSGFDAVMAADSSASHNYIHAR